MKSGFRIVQTVFKLDPEFSPVLAGNPCGNLRVLSRGGFSGDSDPPFAHAPHSSIIVLLICAGPLFVPFERKKHRWKMFSEYRRPKGPHHPEKQRPPSRLNLAVSLRSQPIWGMVFELKEIKKRPWFSWTLCRRRRRERLIVAC
jgi:hypothetical protein